MNLPLWRKKDAKDECFPVSEEKTIIYLYPMIHIRKIFQFKFEVYLVAKKRKFETFRKKKLLCKQGSSCFSRWWSWRTRRTACLLNLIIFHLNKTDKPNVHGEKRDKFSSGFFHLLLSEFRRPQTYIYLYLKKIVLSLYLPFIYATHLSYRKGSLLFFVPLLSKTFSSL